MSSEPRTASAVSGVSKAKRRGVATPCASASVTAAHCTGTRADLSNSVRSHSPPFRPSLASRRFDTVAPSASDSATLPLAPAASARIDSPRDFRTACASTAPLSAPLAASVADKRSRRKPRASRSSATSAGECDASTCNAPTTRPSAMAASSACSLSTPRANVACVLTLCTRPRSAPVTRTGRRSMSASISRSRSSGSGCVDSKWSSADGLSRPAARSSRSTTASRSVA